MKKIDIHVHARLHADLEGAPQGETSAEAMEAFLQEKEIKGGVIMSMGESASADNEECREICRQHPFFRWNCNFDPVSADTVAERMARYKEEGAVGVGELCINEPLDSPFLTEVFRAAERMEMPVLIHMSPRVGYEYGVVDEPGLPLLEKVLKMFPRLKLIGHSQVFWIEISKDAPKTDDGRYGRGYGKVLPGGRLVKLFETCPNLYGDLSAGSGYCAVTRDEEFGLAFLERFSDRLLFGTDTFDVDSKWQAPLWSWMEEKYKEGRISRSTMEKICYRNAQKLYGFDIEEKVTIQLHTPCGRIQGLKRQQDYAFLGIRYGTAKRFCYPEMVREWEGVYDASHYGNACFQLRAFQSEALSDDPFFYHEFREDLRFTYSDDCLYLNIWTPSNAPDRKLPVIVFIHGGAFLAGSSSEKHLMNPGWTDQDVVAVTVNYRVGPFGFLCTRDGIEEAGHVGNYGLYDQLTALMWIRENIEAFGGDPGNVTLMGQSAGGMCVLQHCISPVSAGLFHKAVILSGGGRSKSFTKKNQVEASMAFGELVLKEAGCSSLEQFRQLSAEKIIRSFFTTLGKAKADLSVISPVVDHHMIPYGIEECLSLNAEHKIPYLLCCTGDDLWMPEIVEAIQDWAAVEAEHGNTKCFTALFDRKLPGDESGAFHTADLWYWMGTLDKCWRPLTERDFELSSQMQQYLAEFARKADPCREGLPEWKSYEESGHATMMFTEQESRQKNWEEVKDDVIS